MRWTVEGGTGMSAAGKFVVVSVRFEIRIRRGSNFVWFVFRDVAFGIPGEIVL